MKIFYIKNCLQCSKEIKYPNKKSLNISIKNNSLCRSCAIKKSRNSLKSDKYKRQCSICNNDVFHSTEIQLKNALRKNKPCRSCSQKLAKDKPKNFKRKCPNCKKEISYINELVMEKAKFENKICMSCKTSGKNNPMFGIHRFGDKNPMYNKTLYATWLEKYDKEKADEKYRTWHDNLKQRNNFGENNPNYKNKSNGAKGLIIYSKNCKGKSLDEIYGEEKAKEMKRKISISLSGKNGPMFGKAPSYKSGSGWSGHYKEIQFRSMLELHYLIYLIDNNIPFENGELKKHQIPYEMDGPKNYLPDFYLPETNQIIEIKPKNLLNTRQNKLKFAAAKNKLGDKYVILTENEVVKIDVNILYEKYTSKELIFDEKYLEKFKKYYEKNKF